MRRITYFDEDLQEYCFVDDFDLKNITEPELALIIAKLEEHKEFFGINSLADYLIHIRKARGLTQEAFARIIRENRSTIANYECGRCQPPLYMLRKMSVKLGIPIQEIKSLYIRIKYNIDEDEVGKVFSESRDREEIAKITGQLLKFEREFYGVSKKELAQSLTKQQREISPTRAHIFHPHGLTKIEMGKTQLSWVFCQIIANTLIKYHYADRSCLHELTQYLTKLTERGII